MTLAYYPVRYGHLYHFSQDTTIGASLAYYGEWAEAEIYLASQIIQPGDLVLDVGANVGTHSLAFAHFVTSQGTVIAMDAQHRIFPLLSANMLVNQMHHVQCLNVLVGSEIELKYIPAPSIDQPANFGAFSCAVTNQDAPQQSLLPIPMITIDSLQLTTCSFIKVDVEGMELEVFHGSMDTIDRCQPVIYFEQTGQRNLEEIFAFFQQRQYTLFWHVSNPFNAENFKQNSHNIFGGTCEVNILALPLTKIAFARTLPVKLTQIITPVFTPPIPPIDSAILGWNRSEDSDSASLPLLPI